MMDDLRTRAQLVDFDHAGAIGTVVTRAEIAETAAGTEFPATFVLDLDKIDAGEATAHATVAVDWDQATLEQLLASTEEDEIGLWFDENELAMAFDEVEGHGLRQKAAVLTLAVAAAGATSAPAFARMQPEPGGGGSAQATLANVGPQAGAAERALMRAESETAGLSASSTVASMGPQTGSAERALMRDESVSERLGASSSVSPDPASDKAAVIAGAERARQLDHTGQAAVTSDSGGSSLSTGEIAGVAGGVLLISAAGFGVARRRTPPALPA